MSEKGPAESHRLRPKQPEGVEAEAAVEMLFDEIDLSWTQHWMPLRRGHYGTSATGEAPNRARRLPAGLTRDVDMVSVISEPEPTRSSIGTVR